jgi:sortase A
MTFLRYLGKFLISAGVGVLLFVAWTLWGTGIYTEQQQHRLAHEFARLPEFGHPTAQGRARLRPYQGPPRSWRPHPGDVAFRIRIPSIGVDDFVVEGVGLDQLAMGPGHYPDCRSGFVPPLCTDWPEVWPGEKGRVIVSGHRTTHSHPFYNLQALGRSNKVFVDTKWGDFTYVYDHTRIVPADSTAVVVPSDKAELVLTTCNPRYSASQRLVVYTDLVRGIKV